MAKPAPYSCSAEECNGFLLQCSLILEMQPHLFPNDNAKSYSSFVDHFREVFRKPSWDSSIGKKLYNLKQGKMSVNDYALQFRTLAARSGWNEHALLTTYRQGLDPQVRLHLAAYEDTIGVERFIQLSIRFATRMQSCLEEHQGQQQLNTSLCRPDSVSPPEPANEPMQVESTHLTPAERQRRLTQKLCLYCGSPGHVISACPTRPPCPMVSAIIPNVNTMTPLTTIVQLTAADISIPVTALLDSGQQETSSPAPSAVSSASRPRTRRKPTRSTQ
ncbi:Retrotransposon-derived protein PEG10 [Anabarilius grahami]|uniref:Retrotransposon-derived protein PEG10 n=1 Tax=Anabarilius grahami TaxID=495550 RepID=A0A3N0YCK1_ANAGA|nr:Retrotransposon-derived protein PEG10 [Anabarilius grahami]